MVVGFTADGQPSRPYSSPGQVPAGAAFRSQEFTTGQVGDPDSAATVTTRASTGLTEDSLQFNSMVPTGVRPTSVLQPLRPSMNGQSEQDYQRVLPGGYTLPSQNGQSESSWEKSSYLRMQGQDSV
jgi:hypothetical protein